MSEKTQSLRDEAFACLEASGDVAETYTLALEVRRALIEDGPEIAAEKLGALCSITNNALQEAAHKMMGNGVFLWEEVPTASTTAAINTLAMQGQWALANGNLETAASKVNALCSFMHESLRESVRRFSEAVLLLDEQSEEEPEP